MHVEVTDVTKRYGDVAALDGLDLSVPSGAKLGLLGTNGAGKTTLYRLLIGHEAPDAGSVRVGDRRVADAGPAIRERVGYLPERAGFPPELTARGVLRTTARVRALADVEDRVEEALATVGLADDADRPVEGFSNGMQRRLGLAVAVLPEPDLLLLDEPTAGLDPLGVAAFHRIVEDVRERTGATVVASSHALGEVERLCDRVAVLHDGRVVAEGTVEELRDGSDLGARVEALLSAAAGGDERPSGEAAIVDEGAGDAETTGQTADEEADEDEAAEEGAVDEDGAADGTALDGSRATSDGTEPVPRGASPSDGRPRGPTEGSQ